MKKLLAILAIIMLATMASAAYIPPQYVEESKNVNNDMQLYQFVVKYQGQPWADATLKRLSDKYTNFGYSMRGIHDLETKMAWYSSKTNGGT